MNTSLIICAFLLAVAVIGYFSLTPQTGNPDGQGQTTSTEKASPPPAPSTTTSSTTPPTRPPIESSTTSSTQPISTTTTVRGPRPGPAKIGEISGLVKEPSGIIASRRYPGVFWTHSDSGDGNRIFAIGPEGRIIRQVFVGDVLASDWEDISFDGVDRIWVADIGDNPLMQTAYKLYMLREPDPYGNGSVVNYSMRHIFTYPDGYSHNAEALFVWEGRPYVITKKNVAELYGMEDMSQKGMIRLKKLAEYDTGGYLVTGADISQDGTRLALINSGLYDLAKVRVFERSNDSANVADFFTKPVHSWNLSFDGSQTEAIAFYPGTYDLIIAAEDTNYVFRLPREGYE